MSKINKFKNYNPLKRNAGNKLEEILLLKLL